MLRSSAPLKTDSGKTMWILSKTKTETLRIVIAISWILLLLPCHNEGKTQRPKLCRKMRYTIEVSPPGIKIPGCKRNVTFTKCQGYCESSSRLSTSPYGHYFSYNCKCCQPVKYVERTIHFPCGSTMKVLHIRKCDCKVC